MDINKRSFNLDCLRGFAVVIMIIFHLGYDLNAFKFIKIDLFHGFWYWFPRFIVFCFLFAVGESLGFVYKNGIDKKKLLRRFLKIGGGAFIITITTYFMYPKNFVYFGTLHCIAVASLIGAPLANRPKLSVVLGILIVFSIYAFGITYKQLSSLVNIKSMDFIPIYPWFFVVCFGIAHHHLVKPYKPLPQNSLFRGLAWLGKHSLIIYLIHQPILFGSTLLVYKLSH